MTEIQMTKTFEWEASFDVLPSAVSSGRMEHLVFEF